MGCALAGRRSWSAHDPDLRGRLLTRMQSAGKAHMCKDWAAPACSQPYLEPLGPPACGWSRIKLGFTTTFSAHLRDIAVHNGQHKPRALAPFMCSHSASSTGADHGMATCVRALAKWCVVRWIAEYRQSSNIGQTFRNAALSPSSTTHALSTDLPATRSPCKVRKLLW
jgi:hypothetical protein